MAITLKLSPVAQAQKSYTEAKKNVKHVAFDETRNVEHTNLQWTAEDCKQSWYNAADHHAMKQSAYTLAKQIWSKERKITCSESYHNVLLRVYDFCCDAAPEMEDCVLPGQDKALLTKLIGKSCSRTGLERLCIREISHDKRFRRTQIVAAVLTLQASSRAGSTKSRVELTRLSSETVSRPSRMFARHLATALAASLYP